MSSIVLFIVYKVILSHLGVAAMGVWSLVVGATAIGRIADVGIATGLGRYIALSQARGDPAGVTLAYVETALVINFALYACLGAALYWPLWHLLVMAVDGSPLGAARALLPYAIAAFAAQNLVAVTNAALVGQHRSGLKSRMMIVALMVQGAASILLVGVYGLVGLAIAQIGQYVLSTVCGWVLVHKVAGQRMRFPWRIEKMALKDLASIGLKLQGLTLTSFMFEPATKFVLSATLGVSTLGLYELVSRVVLQVRALLIAPSQNLTPIFTHELQTGGQIGRAYDRAVVLVSSSGLAVMAGLVIAAPAVSLIWLNKVEPLFVLLSLILAFGWWLNVLCVPGYYLGIASGILRWNLAGGAFTSTVAPMAAYGLAATTGAAGGAIGVMTGVAGGCLLTAIMNCRRLGLGLAPPPHRYVSTVKRELAGAGRLLSRIFLRSGAVK